MTEAPVLTLYLREGCSLCEDMLVAVRQLQRELGFQLQTVEVASDLELERRYGEWVPLLASPQGELCHYFLDEQAVRCYFAAP